MFVQIDPYVRSNINVRFGQPDRGWAEVGADGQVRRFCFHRWDDPLCFARRSAEEATKR